MPEKQKYQLPHLILHPFADVNGPDKLVESSRASLMLQGLLPAGEKSREELDRALLEGRYSEVRMLFYVGRDVVRWIEQCLEFANHNPQLRNAGYKFQSFAAYLVNETPEDVQAKLKKWGVADFRSIFMRAIGLNNILANLPERLFLADEFIRNYYRYADQAFLSRQNSAPHTPLSAKDFGFELYASGEYSRMLEKAWAEA